MVVVSVALNAIPTSRLAKADSEAGKKMASVKPTKTMKSYLQRLRNVGAGKEWFVGLLGGCLAARNVAVVGTNKCCHQ